MRMVSSILACIAFVLLFLPTTYAAVTYTAQLTSAGESPPTSPGTGSATVTLDTLAHTLMVDATFSGLLGNTTASHIHAPTLVPLTGNAAVATETPFFAEFPIGVTSGTYSHTFDTTLASTWNASFITANGGTPLGAEAALDAALQAGKAYLNIHSTQFAVGEIRGFLVPEPSALMLIGVAAMGFLARPRRAERVIA